MNANDTLAYMAKMLDKMKQELHELQHLQVQSSDLEDINEYGRDITNLAFHIHLLHDRWKTTYQAPLPEIDLQAAKNNDLIQKLRHIGNHDKRE